MPGQIHFPGMKRPPTLKQIMAAKPGTYGQGAGLYLKVSRTGQRTWEYRYKSLRTNRYTTITIGCAISYTIDEARWKIAEWRTLKARENQDPLTSKRIQQANGTTFGQAADQWIGINKTRWSASQIKNANLRLLAHGKALVTKAIAHIDSDAVEEALKPLWARTPKQARRTVAMWAQVFAFAKHKKYHTGDNPAEWKGNMEFRFSKPGKSKNYSHLPYADVPAFIERLHIRQTRGVAAWALEFCILTATRSGETLGAQWDEFDDPDAPRTWTIPAARMKRSDKDHRVPLSDRAMFLLRRQHEYRSNSPFVFIGYNRARMDDKSMRILLSNMGVKVTVHGFRSSFKSWATEKNEWPWEVIELCLAHKVGTAVAQAYLRGDALDKRRQVMNDWAAHCLSCSSQ
jgi:integrase